VWDPCLPELTARRSYVQFIFVDRIWFKVIDVCDPARAVFVNFQQAVKVFGTARPTDN